MNWLQEAIEYKASLWTYFHCICHCNKWINLSNHYAGAFPKTLTMKPDLQYSEPWIVSLTKSKHVNYLHLSFILSNYFCYIWSQVKRLLFACKNIAFFSDTKTAHVLHHARSCITKLSTVVWAQQHHDNFW